MLLYLLACLGDGEHEAKNKRTKRKYYPNLFEKKFYIPEEDRWITLRVSAAGIRLINKVGISEALRRAKEKGYIKNY